MLGQPHRSVPEILRGGDLVERLGIELLERAFRRGWITEVVPEAEPHRLVLCPGHLRPPASKKKPCATVSNLRLRALQHSGPQATCWPRSRLGLRRAVRRDLQVRTGIRCPLVLEY